MTVLELARNPEMPESMWRRAWSAKILWLFLGYMSEQMSFRSLFTTLVCFSEYLGQQSLVFDWPARH
jgi:hypothetical protein